MPTQLFRMAPLSRVKKNTDCGFAVDVFGLLFGFPLFTQILYRGNNGNRYTWVTFARFVTVCRHAPHGLNKGYLRIIF